MPTINFKPITIPIPRGINFSLFLARFSWVFVVLSAFALSNWSLFEVGRHYGFPVYLAPVLSVALDGAAIVCGDLALRYAREHSSSGLLPRFSVFLLSALSAYLNSVHATIVHLSLPGHIAYAAPPVIGTLIFELNMRFQRRTALRDAGRIAESLPVFGLPAWLLHFRAAFRSIREITLIRLNSRVQIELARCASLDAGYKSLDAEINGYAATATRNAVSPDALEARGGVAQLALDSADDTLPAFASKSDAVKYAFDTLGKTEPASEIVEFLASKGIDVSAAYVRTVKARDLKAETE